MEMEPKPEINPNQLIIEGIHHYLYPKVVQVIPNRHQINHDTFIDDVPLGQILGFPKKENAELPPDGRAA